MIERPGWENRADRVERLLLASGKIAVELEERLDGEQAGERMHLVRVEQLYPFPEEEILRAVRRFPRLREMVWVQEEPRNMGAWTYAEPRLRAMAPAGIAVRYVGRPERSSPAEGFSKIHDIEQRRILDEATCLTPTQYRFQTGRERNMMEIKVPELAESITEGTISKWVVREGEAVREGDVVAELETDKVNVEISAEQSGVLKKS